MTGAGAYLPVEMLNGCFRKGRVRGREGGREGGAERGCWDIGVWRGHGGMMDWRTRKQKKNLRGDNVPRIEQPNIIIADGRIGPGAEEGLVGDIHDSVRRQ